MRILVHLSDLHFGRVDRGIVDALVKQLERIKPNVVAVSGDLTQRGRAREFREARSFLDMIGCPLIVVPGNHDVPLFNIVARFLYPLRGYQRHISKELRPFYQDEETAVAGINTTRSLTAKGGGVRIADVKWICDKLQRLDNRVVKIIVSHHPFELPDNKLPAGTTRSERNAFEVLARCGADVFLTGHLHVSYAGTSAASHMIGGRSAIVVGAGTATSTRVRGETNAFNVLRIDDSKTVVERLAWQAGQNGFEITDTERFEKSAQGWEH